MALDNEEKNDYPRGTTTEEEMNDLLCVAFTIPQMHATWSVFDRHAVGVFVEGDPHIPPMRWWRGSLTRWLNRRNVAVFNAGPKERLRGYRVGVARLDREPLLCAHVVQHQRIAVPIWHASFHAFITDPRGEQEGRLYLDRIQTYKSAQNDGIPITSV